MVSREAFRFLTKVPKKPVPFIAQARQEFCEGDHTVDH
jgi:hypothetical protein